MHHILYKLHLPCTPLCTYEFLHILSYNYVLFLLISICTTHIQTWCFGDLLYPFKFNNWNAGCFFHGIITSPLLTQDISLLFWFGQAHCCWHLDWANGNHETMVRTWLEATYPLPSRVFQKRIIQGSTRKGSPLSSLEGTLQNWHSTRETSRLKTSSLLGSRLQDLSSSLKWQSPKSLEDLFAFV